MFFHNLFLKEVNITFLSQRNSASLSVSISITDLKISNCCCCCPLFIHIYIYFWIKIFFFILLAHSLGPIKSPMMVFFITRQYNERYRIKASLVHQMKFFFLIFNLVCWCVRLDYFEIHLSLSGFK